MDHSHFLLARHWRLVRGSLATREPFPLEALSKASSILMFADGVLTLLIETLQWLPPHS